MGRWFDSDNNATVCPEIMAALARANAGHCTAYGTVEEPRRDPYSVEALALFRRHFGDGIAAHFVYNGTAANVLAVRAVTRSWNAVICAEGAHLNVHECGGPENYCGTKLLVVPSPDGKITPDGIDRHVKDIGDEHVAQPRVVSITQATERGTVYTPEETSAIARCAHERGMLLHMDGARLANAAAHLGTSLRAITRDLGVDVLSFGATKNGGMFGDAVVFMDASLAPDFRYIRKQAMQLHSKMRFIAAQFVALLSGDLWLRNARHSNAMATLLAEKVARIPGVTITQPTEANSVFVRLPQRAIEPLCRRVLFHTWDARAGELRWMASFDTTEEDVESFVAAVREVLG